MAYNLEYNQPEIVQEPTIAAAIVKAVDIMENNPKVSSVLLLADQAPDYSVTVTRIS